MSALATWGWLADGPFLANSGISASSTSFSKNSLGGVFSSLIGEFKAWVIAPASMPLLSTNDTIAG
ncbi:MAG: hypothetical protein JW395_2058 [Nitrospira sp.]|nr:hypothetical protein [Nitrospira sp.]